MQLPSVATSLMFRMYEQRPHVPIGRICNRESYDLALNLDDPTATELFKMLTIVAFGDDREDEPILRVPKGALGASQLYQRRLLVAAQQESRCLPDDRHEPPHARRVRHRDDFLPVAAPVHEVLISPEDRITGAAQVREA